MFVVCNSLLEFVQIRLSFLSIQTRLCLFLLYLARICQICELISFNGALVARKSILGLRLPTWISTRLPRMAYDKFGTGVVHTQTLAMLHLMVRFRKGRCRSSRGASRHQIYSGTAKLRRHHHFLDWSRDVPESPPFATWFLPNPALWGISFWCRKLECFSYPDIFRSDRT